MLHLIVVSGMCNRLFPIISAMRYARQSGQKITIYWKPPVSRLGLPYVGDKILPMEHLHCFFQSPPDIILKTWVPDLIKHLENDPDQPAIMAWDGSKIIPDFLPRDSNGKIKFPSNFMNLMQAPLHIKRSKNLIINMPTSPFGFPEDPMQTYRKYPQIAGITLKKSQYELELSKFARKLKLISGIQNIVNFQYNKIFAPFNQKKIGIHVRRTDLKTQVTAMQLDQAIKKIVQEFPEACFFICSDDYQLQQSYCQKYPKFKSYQDPEKVLNNIQGVQKSLIDLYLLGCCDYIFGTKGSSFSYYSWMLARDSCLFQIHS